MTLFIRALAVPLDEKGTAIREATARGGKRAFELDSRALGILPGSPFAYWAIPAALDCYRIFDPVSSCGLNPLSTKALSR
jgi:hypothetical protein